MEEQGLFVQEGELYRPTTAALSPWGSDRLHGGPVLGLFAHAARLCAGDGELILTRLTADLFARVSPDALRLESEVVRRGRRMLLCDLELISGDRAVARASAVFAQPGKGTCRFLDGARPEGPEGLSTRSLIGERRIDKLPPGFHLEVETRWGTERGPGRVIWFRMPRPLLVGGPRDPVVAAAALSDFTNAVCSIAAYEAGRASAHINVDTTLYFERPPVGEWLGIAADLQSDLDGISIAQGLHYDVQGRFGRSVQARLETAF